MLISNGGNDYSVAIYQSISSVPVGKSSPGVVAVI